MWLQSQSRRSPHSADNNPPTKIASSNHNGSLFLIPASAMLRGWVMEAAGNPGGLLLSQKDWIAPKTPANETPATKQVLEPKDRHSANCEASDASTNWQYLLEELSHCRCSR